MHLHTKRMILRRWQLSDASALFHLAKDSLVGPSARWPAHESVCDSCKMIRDVLSVGENYALQLKTSVRLIGCVSLLFPGQGGAPMRPNEAEIGYWIGRAFWNHGYASEAVRALLYHAFLTRGLHGIWCGYFEGNLRSKHVQQACGFVYHHTNPSVCTQTQEFRTIHFTYLSRIQYLANFKSP